MSNFLQKLEDRVTKSDSLLCIGLDPHVGQLKGEPSAAEALQFCKKIVDETHPFAAAFKPNSAFFECFGESGFAALKELSEYIPKDIPIILDVKRGDIDTTAQAYANASYDIFNVDSVTLSPYMGWDSIQPFVTNKYSGKGAFILCKTSNKSSKEFQEVTLQTGQFLYEKVLDQTIAWNNNLPVPTLGVVAGATDLIALERIRQQAPDIWILCPGVGAQGGEAHLVCNKALRKDGSGLLVSVSRGISAAQDMAAAAEKLKNEINALRTDYLSKLHLESPSNGSLLDYQRDFINFAMGEGALQFGSFKLKSGRISPYFFNAGKFCDGRSLSILARSYAKAVKQAGIEFDVIFGPAYKGIPLVTAFSMAWYDLFGENKAIAYNRKEAKDHGEGGVLVGANMANKKVLIIDDVITAGTAIREAVNILVNAEAIITATVVSLDRQEKTTEDGNESAIQQVVKEYGFPVVSIIKLENLISFIIEAAQSGSTAISLADIEAYRAKYGV